MTDENLFIIRGRRISLCVGVLAWRAGALPSNKRGKAWQTLGVPRKRPCGIFRRFVFSRCEHAATRL